MKNCKQSFSFYYPSKCYMISELFIPNNKTINVYENKIKYSKTGHNACYFNVSIYKTSTNSLFLGFIVRKSII